MASTPASNEPKKSRLRRKDDAGATKAPGRSSQFRQVFETTLKNDPAVVPWMIGAFAAVFVVFLIIGLAVSHPFYFGFIGLLLGLVAAAAVLLRRANSAIYKSIEGQPGASVAAMSSMRKGWFVEQEPVAAYAGRNRQVRDLSSTAMVFRAVGKPGVVLVAEGPKGAASRLLAQESKRSSRLLGPEVPMHTMRIGSDEEAVPVERLVKDMQKLPRVLTDEEAAHVTKRLRALSGAKPQIPAGVDPSRARVNRSAMRGR